VRRASLILLAAGSLAASPARPVAIDDPGLRPVGGRLELDGRPYDGVVRAFYESGAPREERRYRGGVEAGTHRGWWENGRERFVASYRNGVLDGAVREWTEGGQLYHLAHFADGHERGTQRMWNPDGSLRANYVVEGGRRYGFIGAVGCTGGDSASVAPSAATPSVPATSAPYASGGGANATR
jgi:hypothetical protein